MGQLTRAMTACAVACFAVLLAAAEPLTSSPLENSQIQIRYEEPANRYLQPVYERLQKRQILEELKQFLSPLRLPTKLVVRTTQCNQTNAFYQRGSGGVTLCYEYIDFVDRMAPKADAELGIMRDNVVVGAFLRVLFHELGHAVFDLLNVPIFAGEEDAADQIAAFILTQFGKQVALRTLTGGAYFLRERAEPWPRTWFSDTHGHDLQRYYNYLCIAYGGHPETFGALVDNGLLPKKRAVHCRREYQQVRQAFIKTVLPHIDQDLLRQVQARDWLRPGDGK